MITSPQSARDAWLAGDWEGVRDWCLRSSWTQDCGPRVAQVALELLHVQITTGSHKHLGAFLRHLAGEDSDV